MPTWDVRFDLHVSLGDEELIRLVSRAEALAQIVRGIPISPLNYERIDRLNISRAVRGTTGIEGANLSEEEVRQILESNQQVLGQARAREEMEARNAGAVMEFVAKVLQENPDQSLTEATVCEIHRLTTTGIDYPHNTPGQYRSHAVSALTYVPPQTHDEVCRLMDEFVGWLNEDPVCYWSPVIKAVAAHFYFISVHPFGDGNGRTARAIESYLLYQGKINVVGFYSLSNFYYRNRTEYVEMLDHVRFRSGGDLTPFLKFAIKGLVEELEEVRAEVLRAVTVVVFRDFARETLELSRRASAGTNRMQTFLEHLHDSVAIADIRNGRHYLSSLYKGLSSKTLDRDLKFLEQHNLIVRESRRVRRNLEVMRQFTR